MYLGVLLFGKQRLSIPTQKSLDPGDVLNLSRNGFTARTARTADPFCHSLPNPGITNDVVYCKNSARFFTYSSLSFLLSFFFFGSHSPG